MVLEAWEIQVACLIVDVVNNEKKVFKIKESDNNDLLFGDRDRENKRNDDDAPSEDTLRGSSFCLLYFFFFLFRFFAPRSLRRSSLVEIRNGISSN